MFFFKKKYTPCENLDAFFPSRSLGFLGRGLHTKPLPAHPKSARPGLQRHRLFSKQLAPSTHLRGVEAFGLEDLDSSGDIGMYIYIYITYNIYIYTHVHIHIHIHIHIFSEISLLNL